MNWKFWKRKEEYMQVDVAKPTKRKRWIGAARKYTAATTSYQTADWRAQQQTANEEILQGGSKLRDRAREAERNDEYGKNFVRMMKKNIVGSGLKLVMKVTDSDGKTLDTKANAAILEAWLDWNKQQNCSTTRRNSWWNIQQLWASTKDGRDGEIFIRMVDNFDNKYGFALMPFEGDFIPLELQGQADNGNEIRLGCELNEWGEVVAYYFAPNRHSNSKAIRLPAEFILHGYDEDRPGQLRGISPMHASLMNMHTAKGYREAEVIAARVAAAKVSTYERDPAIESDEAEDLDGYVFDELNPGDIGVSPKGWLLKRHGNERANNSFGDFMKGVVRTIASGLGISYNVLNNDLEGVSYSSMRGGVQDARETYKEKIQDMIDDLAIPVFERWLFNSLLRGVITVEGRPLKVEDFDKFNNPEFIGRVFDWVDPLKDGQLAALEIKEGWKSPQQVATSRGREYPDVMREQAEAAKIKKEAFAAVGIDLTQEETIENETD